MKFNSLLVFFLFFEISLFAQTVLVPYRVGDKFGLSDTNKNIVLAPEFDKINFERGYDGTSYYFTFNTNTEKKNITSKSGYVSQCEKIKTGIIINGKKIIETDQFESYRNYNNQFTLAYAGDNFLARNQKGKCTDSALVIEFTSAEEKEYYEKRKDNMTLFNRFGENLFPQGTSKIQFIHSFDKNDINYSGYHNITKSSFVLFLVQDLDSLISLFQFNVETGKIDQWLLKDKLKIELSSEQNDKKFIINAVNKKDDTEEKYFISMQASGYSIQKQNIKKDKELNSENETLHGIDPPPPPPTQSVNQYSFYNSVKMDAANNKKVKIRFLNQDKIMDLPTKVDSIIRLNVESKIYRNDTSITVHNILAYRKKNKWGFIIDTIYPAKYKSFGLVKGYHSYLTLIVVQKNRKKTQYGLLDISGKVILPITYDNIRVASRFEDDNPEYLINTAIDLFYLTKNNQIEVYNPYNNKILPGLYDSVRYNNSIYTFKNNLKGLITTSNIILQPLFKKQPTDIIRDYFRVPNFDLVILKDEKNNFYGYATKEGKVFVNEEE